MSLGQPSLVLTGEILLGILVVVAGIYDLRYRRVPNWLALSGIIAGFTWNGLSSGGSGLGRAAAGLGLGFALYIPFYMIRALRAGDVKLLAAIGSITGPGNVFWVFLFSALIGGVVGVVVAVLKKRTTHTFFNLGMILHDLMQFKAPYKSNEELDVTTSKGLRLPYAAIMAAGAATFIFIAQHGLNI